MRRSTVQAPALVPVQATLDIQIDGLSNWTALTSCHHRRRRLRSDVCNCTREEGNPRAGVRGSCKSTSLLIPSWTSCIMHRAPDIMILGRHISRRSAQVLGLVRSATRPLLMIVHGDHWLKYFMNREECRIHPGTAWSVGGREETRRNRR